VPLPVFPVPPVEANVALEDAAATVVDVVELVEVVELDEPALVVVEVELVEAEVAASPSKTVATFRSAATIVGVGGADPNTSSSDWASGPTTYRMYCASF
jgi:hypothetical protein